MSVIEEESVAKSNSSTTIVAATATIVAVLGVGYCMRVLYSRMNAEELERQATKAQQEQIYMTKIKSKTLTKDKVDDVDAVIDETRMHDSHMKLKAGAADEELEEQYNPLHDFAVFATGNGRVGGVQTLQQKMNLADANSDGDVENESEESARSKETEREAAAKKEGRRNLLAAGDRTLEACMTHADTNSKAGSSGQRFYPAEVAREQAPEMEADQSEN